MSAVEKKRILIVDDEDTLSHLMRINLELAHCYEVCEENKGTRALETALRFKPDVVLMDVIMPDKSGEAVASEIRAHPLLQNVSIIFFTAAVSRKKTTETEKVMKGQLYLSKPARTAEVIQMIEQCLRNQRR